MSPPHAPHTHRTRTAHAPHTHRLHTRAGARLPAAHPGLTLTLTLILTLNPNPSPNPNRKQVRVFRQLIRAELPRCEAATWSGDQLASVQQLVSNKG